MTQQERRKERIPQFRSREEMAEWFDAHDIADYLDEFEVVEVQADSNLTKSLNVRMAPDMFTKLQIEASEKGIGTSTLVRMWILDRLHQTDMVN